jgi:SAM-dependent methyltransferase
VNVDVDGGDVRADIARLPFKKGAFNEVLASHVLEHILDLPSAMRELHRVLRPGGLLRAIVPYGIRGLFVPSHVHAFDLHTMDYFCRKGSGYHGGALFRLKRREITDYSIPFKWHIHRYLFFLGVTDHDFPSRIRIRLPLARRKEITYWMEKLPEDDSSTTRP